MVISNLSYIIVVFSRYWLKIFEFYYKLPFIHCVM